MRTVKNTALQGLALVLLLLLVGCGGTTTRASGSPSDEPDQTSSPPAGPAHVTSERCADLVVLGLRGQGQSRRGHDGAGRDVDRVARTMLPYLGRGTTLRIEGVPFPARSGGDAAYTQDVRTGVRLVRDRLAAMAVACPKTHVALVGYSQGAEVVHRSAVALEDDDQVAVVVLLGDPLRNPGDPVVIMRLGTAALAGRGNGGLGARFPDAVRRRVIEVCVHGDDVCNAPPAGRVGPPSPTHHTAYKARATQQHVAVEAARVVVGSGG